MMSRRLLVIALAAVVLVGPALPAIAQPAARPQTVPVQLAPELGVAPEAVLDVQRAAELAQEFFRREYSVELTREVRIVIVPDRTAYAAAMRREFRVDDAEAERRARTTTAWTAGSTIVMTVTPGSARAFRMVLTAHELVHQLQIQVSTPVNPWRLYWVAEGVADAVAAHIVETNGYAPAGTYRERWVTSLRRAARRPDLQELSTQDGWFASLDRSGSGVTYALSALAAHYLAERHGHGAILTYFRTLGITGDGAPAFQRTFTQPLDLFIDGFRRFLTEQIGATHRPSLALAA
jgi:hypothetical protein